MALWHHNDERCTCPDIENGLPKERVNEGHVAVRFRDTSHEFHNQRLYRISLDGEPVYLNALLEACPGPDGYAILFPTEGKKLLNGCSYRVNGNVTVGW